MRHHSRGSTEKCGDERPPLAQGIREGFLEKVALAGFRRMGRMWGDDYKGVTHEGHSEVRSETQAAGSSE